MFWQAKAIAAVLVLAGGCSVLGSSSPGLTKRCERSLPAIDAAIALSAGVIAVASAAVDDGGGPIGELVGIGIVFGASSFVGYSRAGQCRKRGEQLPVIPSVSDEFLGARTWRTTMWVYAKESPLVALERAYARAAVICEGRGLSAQSSTPLQPQRPRQVALTYKCH